MGPRLCIVYVLIVVFVSCAPHTRIYFRELPLIQIPKREGEKTYLLSVKVVLGHDKRHHKLRRALHRNKAYLTDRVRHFFSKKRQDEITGGREAALKESLKKFLNEALWIRELGPQEQRKKQKFCIDAVAFEQLELLPY